MIDEGQRDRVHSLVPASVDRGARSLPAVNMRGSFTGRPCLTGWSREPGICLRGVRPGRSGDSLLEPRRGGCACRRHGLRAVAGHPHPGVVAGLELANRIPSGMVHINDQTWVTNPTRRSVASAPWQRLAVRRPVESRSVHRHPVGVRQESDSRIPVMAVSACETTIASGRPSWRRASGRPVARTGRTDGRSRLATAPARATLSAERSSLPQKEPR